MSYNDGGSSLMGDARANNNMDIDETTFAMKNGQGVARTNRAALVQKLAIHSTSRKESEPIPSNVTTTPDGYVDLEIPNSDQVHLLKELLIEVTYKNLDAVNPVTLNMFPLQFQRIEILFNGSTVDFTTYPEQQWLEWAMDITAEDKAQTASMAGMRENVDYSTIPVYSRQSYDNAIVASGNNTIAAGGTGKFTGRIYWPWLYHYICLFTLDQRPRLRFYFSNTNMLDSASVSTTVPQLTSLRGLLSGPRFNQPHIREKIQSAFRAAPAVYAGTVFKKQNINIIPVSGVENRDIALTAVSGRIPYFFYYLQDNPVSKEGLISSGTLANPTWHAISQFSLKKPDGSYYNYEKENTDLYQTYFVNNWFRSQLFRQKAIYPYSFASAPASTTKQGTATGFYVFDNRHSLSITPVSVPNNTFVDGTPMNLIIQYAVDVEVIQTRNGKLVYRELTA